MPLLVLDRPGILQPAPDQPRDRAMAGIADCLARLSQAGFTLVVASNEPGISSGEQDLDQLEASHTRLSELVENRGGAIAAFFYCPHTEQQQCHCRKPNTGLLDAIELEFSVPANEMVLITDQQADLDLAQATGATTILVLTARGLELQAEHGEGEITCCNNLHQACEYLLTHY